MKSRRLWTVGSAHAARLKVFLGERRYSPNST